jgi:lipopolysaccharide/colanic/teichoic acid biosynthesis glycosyltransferase
LRKDPRITRIGNILRLLSIDELPQLINVLKGDMSLVGPRPFFPEQQSIYGEAYENYVKVRPGITGMWQTYGRNQSTFAQRAQWDEYYVRNWSIWLDIFILFRTVGAVISKDGAY